jgi:glutathione S-transferase
MDRPRFELWHMPQSRSSAVLWLLEELGVRYAIRTFNPTDPTDRTALAALNPAGKVPTLIDHGPDGTWRSVVTETTAVALYLADAVPEAGLAPRPGTPERGPYLSWLVLRGAALEPAFTDLMLPRAGEVPRGALGWRPWGENVQRLEAALAEGPYLQGERFSAADILTGSLLFWARQWGKLDALPAITRYLATLEARPARTRALARDGVRTWEQPR